MSLQVWLPLNGNLNNQGLSNITFSYIQNNSALSVNNSGKIGKCYERTASAKNDLIRSSTTINLSGDISMACWAYVTGTIGDTANGLVTNHSHSDSTGVGITVKQVSTSDYRISCNTGTGSNRTYCTYYGTTNIKNAWHHLALTYNKNAKQLQLWVDGNVEYTLNNYTNASKSDYIDIFNWSTTYYTSGDFRPTAKLNDVRIYDHCLSAKEVKELSKGLVLHYPLKDQYIENTTNISSQSSKGGWNNSGAAQRETNNADLIKYAPYPKNVYSIKVTTAGNCALTFGNTTSNVPSKTLTCSVYCYLSGAQDSNTVYIRSTKTDGNIGNFSYNGSTNPTTWPLNQWIRLKTTITTNSEATTIYFCTYANVLGNTRAFCGWQIEEKDHVTPFTESSRSETAVYDCSGYSNNGTKSGAITCDSDTSRYTTSYNYADSNTSIAAGNLSTMVPDGVFTMNVWFKKQTDKWSAKGYETIFGGPSGFELEAKNSSTNSPCLLAYSWGKGSYVYELDKWNMLTMVRTSSETKFYINGNLVITGSAGTIPSGNYYFGAWSNASSQNYMGKLSDARIYAIALSAKDIEELYNTSLAIDNTGKSYAYEYIEV